VVVAYVFFFCFAPNSFSFYPLKWYFSVAKPPRTIPILQLRGSRATFYYYYNVTLSSLTPILFPFFH
jgi:hypothetical protein